MSELVNVLKKQRQKTDELFAVLEQQDKLLQELIELENEKVRAILKENSQFQEFIKDYLNSIKK